MKATRANTAITTDGGVFGSTTETPPEDPPMIWVQQAVRDAPDPSVQTIVHFY